MAEALQGTLFRNGPAFAMATDCRLPKADASKSDLRQLYLDLAYSDGCTSPDRTLSDGRGLLQAVERFSHLNWWFNLVDEELLYRAGGKFRLRTKTPRLPDERPEGYEEGSAPPEYQAFLIGMNEPVRFAIPRVITAYTGSTHTETPVRRRAALAFVWSGIERAENPIQLLAFLAEDIFDTVLPENPQGLLFQIFKAQKLREEGCPSVFLNTEEVMRRDAPNLMAVYDGMSPEYKKTHGIINFRELQ